jgi:hypothetical protein
MPPGGYHRIRLSAERLLAAPSNAPAWLYKLAIRDDAAALEAAERAAIVIGVATSLISHASSAAEDPSPTATTLRPANGSGVR